MKNEGFLINLKHFRKNATSSDYYLINYILICDGKYEVYTSFISQSLYEKISKMSIKPLSKVNFIYEIGSNLKAKLVDVE